MEDYYDDELNEYLQEMQYVTQLVNRYELSLRNDDNQYFDSDQLEDIFNFYLNINATHRAKQVLDVFAKMHPTDDTINLLRGQLLYEEGKNEELLSLLDAVDLRDYDLWHLLRLGALIQLHRYEEAEREGLDIIHSTSEDEKPRVTYNIAREFHQADCFEFALKFYEIGLLFDDKNRKLLMGAARCRGALSDYKKSFEYTDQLIELDPYNDEAWLIKATGYVSQHLYDEAIDAYDYAIAINPSNEYAWIAKVKALSSAMRDEEAYKCLDDMALQFSRYKDIAVTMKADILYARERYKEAHALYKKGFNLEAFSSESALKYLDCKLRLHRWKETIALGNDLCRIIKDDPTIYEKMADAYYELHDWKKATSTFHKAVMLDPDDGYLLLRYGTLLLDSGNIKKGEKQLQKAHKLYPQLPEPLVMLAVANYMKGDYVGSAIYLNEAYSIDKEQAQTFLRLCPKGNHIVDTIERINNRTENDNTGNGENGENTDKTEMKLE